MRIHRVYYSIQQSCIAKTESLPNIHQINSILLVQGCIGLTSGFETHKDTSYSSHLILVDKNFVIQIVRKLIVDLGLVENSCIPI